MIFDAQVLTRFWPEAVATSAYLLNRLPSKTLNHKTPLQILATQADLPHVQMLGMLHIKRGIDVTTQSLTVYI